MFTNKKDKWKDLLYFTIDYLKIAWMTMMARARAPSDAAPSDAAGARR